MTPGLEDRCVIQVSYERVDRSWNVMNGTSHRFENALIVATSARSTAVANSDAGSVGLFNYYECAR